eukprot:CAMPEP_0171928006 /NCGR_PEP_ID=MMETSP0993-20121228/26358_1 /TAXON_ID=483369 /ORGANISM="non described non described, Strain CCMP2098" /LENGTH=397 /DNA_ID=CAMNT_0012567209 /DNA_START=300 /DNA_END=1493 /DNA_ORIENTATION=-
MALRSLLVFFTFLFIFAKCGFSFTSPAKNIIVDWETLFNTEDVEIKLCLDCLRGSRPPRPPTICLGETLAENRQPWDETETIPSHRFRTFDTSRRYSALLRELCPQRPCDSVLLLRLLFEEDAIGRPRVGGRSNARGTRPLTVGEIQANWDAVVRDRCIAKWVSEEGAKPSETEAVLVALDKKLVDLHREWLESDLASYAALTHLPDSLDGAVGGLLRGCLDRGGTVTVLLRTTSLLATVRERALGLLGTRLLAGGEHPIGEKNALPTCDSAEGGKGGGKLDSATAVTLKLVSSLGEVETIVQSLNESEPSVALSSQSGERNEEAGSGEAGGVAYLSAFWNPLVFLGAHQNRGRSLKLVEWAKRHSTFAERAQAKASNSFLFTEELLGSPSSTTEIS